MSSHLEDAYVPEVVPDDDLAYFEKSGHGTRIGWGETPTVIVVDMTEEFTSDGYDVGRSDTGSRAVAAMADVVDTAREADVPVVYTKPETATPTGYRGTTKRPHDEDSRAQRRRGNQITTALAPEPDDLVLEKPRASAFFDTHLANYLHHYGVDTVIVGGMTTSGCVRATVVDAHSSNFRTIVPEEATADRSVVSHEISLFDLDMKYGDVTPTEEVLAHLQGTMTDRATD